MTVLELTVGAALALAASVLAGIAIAQRRRLRELAEEAAGHPAAGAGAPAERAALPALVGAMHEAALVHGERIEAVNEAFATLFGQPASRLVGRRLQDLVSPEYADLAALAIERHLQGMAAPRLIEVELADAHGQVTRMELTATVIESETGRRLLFTGVDMLPTTEATGGTTPTSRAQFALDALGEGLVTTDAAGHIDYINLAAEAMAGQRRDGIIGSELGEVFSFVDEHDRRPLPDPGRQCIASGSRTSLGRRALMVAGATGEEFGVEVSAAPIRGEMGEIVGAVVLLHDVTELRGLARQMSYQASHDALTGLVNRREFERRVSEALEGARGGRQSHVMCYLDLDRFKAVNDTSGHLAGDNMLREVATLVRGAVRDSDTVGRLGGDEFGVLLVGCPLQKARQIADDIGRAVAEYRFVWRDRIFNVGISAGLVEVTGDLRSLEEVMSAADSACYVAKQQGDNHVHVYSSRDEVVARNRGEIQWLHRLQAALRDGYFELLTQVIEPSRPGPGDGPALEVFVRLRGEGGELVLPAEFMPAAERYRLMSLVDRWVLRAALAALASGAIRVPPGRSLSINLSGQTLADPSFLEYVVEELDRSGVQPQQVCFEVTETAVIGNLANARRFIGVLHGMGCRFALDDFGNDLGSFAHLKQLSMDYLKLDGSFMRDLSRDSVNRAMVTAMIGMARTLNFRLIAEQVEDNTALEAARSMGIDFVQGYAVGRLQPLRPAA